MDKAPQWFLDEGERIASEGGWEWKNKTAPSKFFYN